MNDEKRIKLVEEAILIMKGLLVDHSERMEKYFLGLEKEKQLREEWRREYEESQRNFDFKLNALIDAQMRNEVEIDKLWQITRSHSERIENLEQK